MPVQSTTKAFENPAKFSNPIWSPSVDPVSSAIEVEVQSLLYTYQELMDWLMGLSGNELETIGTCSL